MKSRFTYFFTLFVIIVFCGNVKAQTTVLSQNFEGNAWAPTAYVIGVLGAGATTIPSGAPANIPASQSWTGNGTDANSLWHRSDYRGAWASNSDICPGGGFPPPSCGANGTSHSALFDGFDAQTNYQGYLYSPAMNLSGYCSATVSFYYFNYDEGSVLVQFWNGASWVTAATGTNTAPTYSWIPTTITVPASCLINGTYLQFYAYSNFNSYPIGIDEIVVTGYSPPVNDACASATAVATSTYNNALANSVTYSVAVTGSNVCATADQVSSTCYNNKENVWYTFTPTVSGSYYFGVTTGTMVNPAIDIYTGSCGAFVSVLGCAGNNLVSGQPAGFYSSTYSYSGGCDLTAGTTYYIMVDDHGSAGTFTLTISNLSNDLIANAAIIANCGSSFTSSTIGATNCDNCVGDGYYNNLDCNSGTTASGNVSGADVYPGMTVENDSWYQFCTVGAGTYTVSMSPVSASCIGPDAGTATELQMNVYTGTSAALNWVNGNVTGNSTALVMTVTLAANGCGFIEVDGFAGTNCDYNITLSGACTLPIELLSFTGENIDNKKIKLNWATASEENVNYFLVQRSADGTDYKEVAKTKATSTSSQKSAYFVFDENPLNGYNYYRLISVDMNGKQNVAAHTMVTNKSHLPHFAVYPNPSNGNLKFNIVNFSSLSIEVEIYDMYGKQVWSSTINLDNSGDNQQQVDLSFLTSGVYFVKATDGNTLYKQSLMISRNN